MRVFTEANKRNTDILAVTTSPRAYEKTRQHFRAAKNVRVALGFHPELLVQRSTEKALFFELMKSVRFLGEIGIDGPQRMKESNYEQEEFFCNVIQHAAVSDGKIISIHSRGAIKDVLRILENNEGNYTPVLHWFTGNLKELDKAVDLGCWFSINPKMCFTTSGKRIIDHIPLDKMIPETDGPFTQVNGSPYMPWDTTVASYIAETKKISVDEIDLIFDKNLKRLEGIV
jgi:TatD DNase family protein